MFKMIWDNGHACGALGEYATEQEAIDVGEDWLAQMRAVDPEADEEAYSYEVIEEADEEASAEDLGRMEESDWYEELNRGYAADRI